MLISRWNSECYIQLNSQVAALIITYDFKITMKGGTSAMPRIKTYHSPVAACFLIPLGLCMLGLAAVLPFVLEDPIFVFILLVVPSIFTGVIALLHGIAAAFTSIQITENELKLVVPEWRGFPVPPLHRASLQWNEVLAVRHRKEIYVIPIIPFFLSIPFPVDVYAIDSVRERFIIGGESFSWLAKAVTEIASRSGLSIQREEEVSAKLLNTILRGAPAWKSPLALKQTDPTHRHDLPEIE
jgi:hypothetical protein